MTEENKKKKCNCCLILGIVILALGLLADVIGLGEVDIFGWKQILAVVIGAALVLCGTKESRFCKCKKE
ncbi:MAG: hypothetical protein JW847_07105 [Candidatus Omnitrophica bacterium]|nr:hypothetical protein [Candidatus Omnitrophota bacterium]